MKRYATILLAMELWLGAGPLAAQAPAGRPGDKLIGVWASENVFGPTVRGELTIIREAEGWRASVSSLEIPVRHRGDSLSFALPGDLGSFRGTLVPGSRTIHGWWIQPLGVTFSQQFATPIELPLLRPGAWRGTIVPLDDRFDLYLAIWRRADGVLLGAFRNPQFNSRVQLPGRRPPVPDRGRSGLDPLHRTT